MSNSRSDSFREKGLSFEGQRFLQVERLAAYEMANALLEIQTLLQHRLKLRPEECQVFLAILTATVQRFARNADPEGPHLTREPLPETLCGAISRRRLSDSLGIPLETVRRHVARLQERGLIVERARGQLSTPGGTLARFGETEEPRRIALQFANVANAFVRLGILTGGARGRD